MTFWRHHTEKGISFDEMKRHISRDWSADEALDGVAASTSPEALRDLMRHWYHGDYYGEVIVFRGIPLTDLGDGWTTEPFDEIARIPLVQFMEVIDGSPGA